MPQVMLLKKSHQSDQNSQVWTASRRVYCLPVWAAAAFFSFSDASSEKLGEIYVSPAFFGGIK